MGEVHKFSVKGPFRGLVTRVDANLLAENEASDLSNVVLSGNGIEARKGVVAFGTSSKSVDINDTVTRGDSATAGGGWNEYESNGAWSVASNKLRWTNSGGAALHKGFLSSLVLASGWIEADISVSATGNRMFAGVGLRKNGNGNTAFYAAVMTNTLGAGTIDSNTISSISIIRYDGSAYTIIAQDTVASTTYQLSTSAKKLRFMCIGNTLAAFIYNNGSWECRAACVDYQHGAVQNYQYACCVAGTFSSTSDSSYAEFDNIFSDCAVGWRSPRSLRTSASEQYNLLFERNTLRYITPAGGIDGLTDNSSSGAFPGLPVQYAEYGDILYMADGHSPFRITDGETVEDAIVTAPAFTPGVAANAAVANTGVYDYVITYYSSVYGIETVASTKSATITLNGQSVDLSGMTLSADAKIDKHRVYRRKISAGETAWHFVAEIAEATTYTDSVLDADIDYNRVAPLNSRPTYHDFTAIAEYQKRMFYAGSSNGRGRLYFSELKNPSCIGANSYLNVGTNAGNTNPIVSIISAFGVLVVLKRRGLYILTGDDLGNFDINTVTESVGCTGAGTVVMADNLLYWAGESGIFAWDGSGLPVCISDDIDVTYNARLAAADNIAFAMHDERMGAVLWSYHPSSSVYPTGFLVYFYGLSQEIGKRSWSQFTVAECLSGGGTVISQKTGLPEAWWATIQTPSSANTTSHYGVGRYDHDGTNYTDEILNAADQNVSWYWVTGKINGGLPYDIKHWGEMYADFKKQSSNTNGLTMAQIRDDETSATTVANSSMSSYSVARGLISEWARYMRLKLSGSGEAATVYGFGVEVGKEGRPG